MDIQIINSPSCPPLYEKSVLGNWPGTYSGCKCPGRSIKTGYCDDDEEWLCSDYDSIQDEDLYKWKESSFSWCFKPAQKNVDYIKSTSCPYGYSKCGATGICFRDVSGCPVNEIKFTTSSGPDSQNYGTGKYLDVIKDGTNAPLIQAKITYNDLPCFDDTAFVKGSTAAYILLKFYPQGCGKYGKDDYSFQVDVDTEYNLLQANSANNKIFNLPDYTTTSKNTNMYLSGERKIQITEKEECIDIDTKTLDESSTLADRTNDLISVSSILGIIIHSFAVIVAIAVVCIGKQEGFKNVFSKPNAAWRYAVFMSLEALLWIITSGILSTNAEKLRDNQGYFKDLEKSECFATNSQPSLVIGDYDDIIQHVVTRLLHIVHAILGFCVASWVTVAVIPTIQGVKHFCKNLYKCCCSKK